MVGSHAGKELVVTALDGHLLVYGIAADGSLEAIDPPLPATPTGPFVTQVDGALGAHNSIIIADIDGATGNEMYVAGSLGLWKWK